MANYLLLYYQPGAQIWKQLPMTGQVLNIGRAPENDLVLEDAQVSHQHARLYIDARGVWLMDQNSKNGVILSGQRIAAGEWTLLPLNENFTIGAATLRIEAVSPVAYASQPVAPAQPIEPGLLAQAGYRQAGLPQPYVPQKRGGFPIIPILIGGALLLCCSVIAVVLLSANIPSSDKTSISQQTPTSIQTAISGQTPSGSEGGDYVLRRTAPGETTAESREGATSNPPITIALSDGTQVDLPATTKPVTVKLSRESNTVQLNKPGLETSGSMRTLEFDASQVDAAFIPMVTIPAKELGELDPATVNIARVGDIQDNGETLKDQVIYLPFTKDSAGNIVVVDTAASSPAKAAASSGFSTGGRLAMPPAQAGGRTTVKYVVMTFQGHLEWQIAPRLVRMIPDASTLEFRRPADPIKDKEFLIVNGYFSNSCTKEGRFDFQWEIKDLPRLEGIFAYDRDAK